MTDEADCTNVGAVGQSGAKIRFFISANQAANVVTDNGDGTYAQTYFGMANPEYVGYIVRDGESIISERTMEISALPATSSSHARGTEDGVP